jgi:hypothetical protein
VLLVSSGWPAGYCLFQPQQFVKRRFVKRTQDQAQQ